MPRKVAHAKMERHLMAFEAILELSWNTEYGAWVALVCSGANLRYIACYRDGTVEEL